MAISNSFLINIINGLLLRFRRLFHYQYGTVNFNPVFIKYLKHLPPGRLYNHKLFGNKTWFTNGPEYLHGVREIFIEEIYKQSLPEHAYILDCGANIGLSVIYIKKICPTATIVAFEPDQNNFNLLQKNVESHGLQNVELKNQAVWKEDGMLSFDSRGGMTGKISFDTRPDKATMVKATRLKNYLDKRIDFLKIDIEGAEFDVLCDVSEKLNLVKNLFVEYHGTFEQSANLSKLFSIFSKNGFEYYIKEAAPVYKTPFLRDMNAGVSYDLQLNIFCFSALN